jgi:Domain of unknown function (4846)
MTRNQWPRPLALCLCLLAVLCVGVDGAPREKAQSAYPWLAEYDRGNGLVNHIDPPEGYARVKAEDGSYAHWLRHLPLKEGNPPIRLHNGRKRRGQKGKHSIVDIDVGARDLQQCADVIIRLRAEYLFHKERHDEIRFRTTSGVWMPWKKYANGFRLMQEEGGVRWRKRAKSDHSHESFRRYLDTVFIYAGTASLQKELGHVRGLRHMQIGDIFIEGGHPGHSVVIVDIAVHPKTKRKMFLLAQSYMPAQSLHILRNPNSATLSPWYYQYPGPKLITPDWTFYPIRLKRWKEPKPKK